jgi:hypothetical protein
MEYNHNTCKFFLFCFCLKINKKVTLEYKLTIKPKTYNGKISKQNKKEN